MFQCLKKCPDHGEIFTHLFVQCFSCGVLPSENENQIKFSQSPKKYLIFTAKTDILVLSTERRIYMDQTENKHYPFQFTNQMIFIFAVALLLCAACFGVSTWRFVGFLQSGDLTSFYSWLQYIILYLVSILLAVLITAMLIRSRYTVTEKQIILQFGLIKSKYEIKSIYSVHLFQGSNKLALYFDDYHTKYTVVVVNRSWYDDFVKTLLERKPSIEFTYSTAEEEAAEKKK